MKAADGQSIVTLERIALIVVSQAWVTITSALFAINKRSLAMKEKSLCSPFILLCFWIETSFLLITVLMIVSGFQLEKQGYFGVF